MIKTAEFVSLGHPDKTADFITSYILDRLIEQDELVKYGVEVMIKDNTVVLGGEINGHVVLNDLTSWVKEALRQIGYDEHYASLWGNNAVNINKLNVINLIGLQSPEINQGVIQNGWGDQGVFVGYACQDPDFLPRELSLARKLANTFYEQAKQSDCLGLDIKAQITLDEENHIETAILAVPMRRPVDISNEEIAAALGEQPKNIIVNGTGSYTTHSAVADCGMTGRKLACDFYSTACPVGGGSPWTKDATKADLTLNLYARKLAIDLLRENDECFVYLSSCIGRSELPSAVVKTIKNGVIKVNNIQIKQTPKDMIQQLGLNKPVFADMCRTGIVLY